MQKVITINLNGNAFQLDENACDALRAYLDHAEAQLNVNPDKAEIISDLEQAIGEKCRKFFGPHKTVLVLSEIEQVLREMGPVETWPSGGAGDAAANESRAKAKANAEAGAPKRLYRIREGAKVAGICSGLAAYFGIDPTIVRIIFILLTLVSHGAGLLVYFVLMVVIPEATTSEEHAAAQGLPFNAQELVDSAKRNYSEFKDKHWKDKQWKQQWRRQRQQQPGPGMDAAARGAQLGRDSHPRSRLSDCAGPVPDDSLRAVSQFVRESLGRGVGWHFLDGVRHLLLLAGLSVSARGARLHAAASRHRLRVAPAGLGRQEGSRVLAF